MPQLRGNEPILGLNIWIIDEEFMIVLPGTHVY
jgi:2-keto-3-deoxy-galactonokinase